MVEVVLICLSLLAGALFRIRTRSWGLLLRQGVLVPILAGYLGYLSAPGILTSSWWVIVYHSALFSFAHVVVGLGLIDRKALVWAFVGNADQKPDLCRIKPVDLAFIGGLGAVGFAFCAYAFSTLVSLAGSP